MDEEKYITIEGKIVKNSTGEITNVKIVCKNQYAVAMFSDKSIAKKLAKSESQKGKDVRYSKRLNVLVERFKGKTATEVAKIIGNQLKEQGGELNGFK